MSAVVKGPRARLRRSFFDRDTVLVARDLLGAELVHVVAGRELAGRIVETEAYLGPHDLASHSRKGQTPRTRIMFGPPGHAYIYLIYGRYHCMNVVTEGVGHGAAVLIRAVEPLRNLAGRTAGPGLLCMAMDLDRRLNGEDLTGDRLFLRARPADSEISIRRRPRIGVDYAGVWARRHLRFYIRGNPFVSKP